MIELTRLNGKPMVLNSDLIKIAEASPDTMLTLVNGEKLIVREDLAQVAERVLLYRARLLAAVAQRIPRQDGMHRVAALSSLDLAPLFDPTPSLESVPGLELVPALEPVRREGWGAP